MPDRGLRAVRDDELFAEEVQLRERLLDRVLDSFASESFAIQYERAVLLLRATEELARGVHAGLGPALGAADPLELRVGLDSTPLDERLAVGSDLDPLRA